MVLQPQFLALAGLLMLTAGISLPLLVRSALRHGLFSRRRLRLSCASLRLIRRVLMLGELTPGVQMLQHVAILLQESILLVRQSLSRLPALPASGRDIRLMEYARALADDASTAPSAASLLQALRQPEAADLSSSELSALPMAVSIAYVERLLMILSQLIRDERDRRRARRLAPRLSRSRKPVALLMKHSPSLCGTVTLLAEINQPLVLEATNEWLSLLHTNAAEIEARYTHQQLAAANAIQEAEAALKALRTGNWQETAESIDPLHLQLLEDPSGLYPRMTPDTRAALRARAERLARMWRTLPGKVVSSALFLCREAEPRTLEQYVGFYLSEPKGILRLRQQLHTYRGYFRLLAAKYKTASTRLLLWGFSLAIAFPFLHAGHPLGMLPFFLIVCGRLPRAVLQRYRHPDSPPALRVDRLTPELSTLIVLPARLETPSDALHMLHRLSTARHGLRTAGADFLLLGDHGERISQVSNGDAAIHTAVCQGLAALSQENTFGRLLYLHRARSWAAEKKAFSARGGRFGAVESVCRLIAQGECSDLFDCATFSPDTLYRRYAFVLVIDEESPLLPGMLQTLLSAAAHPGNTRFPTPEGPRGFSCFKPVSLFHISPSPNVRLLRPDAYLEAIDGILADDEPGDQTFLTDALTGCQPVPMLLPAQSKPRFRSMAGVFSAAFRHWQMVRWLLPWVKGDSDIIRNPLPAEARLQLRELLRDSIMPLCQCVLLLYSLLSHSLFLLLCALLLPAASSILLSSRYALSDAVLLPSRTAIRCLAVFRAFLTALRQDDTLASSSENEKRFIYWCQGTACALCTLFGLLLPPAWFPSLFPILLFAAFPLLLSGARTPREPLPRTLTNESRPLLFTAAAATWRYFQETSSRFSPGIPPDFIQTAPPSSMLPAFSADGVAMSMLAAISAKEVALISSDEAAARISHALDILTRMPMPLGLPCRKYGMNGQEVIDSSVDARACGLLLTALMTSAQALRTWLPQLSPCFYELPTRLDTEADALDLRRLYDSDAGLFFEQLDSSGSGQGYLTCYNDEALLLSLAACAKQLIPPAHFGVLSRTRVPVSGSRVPLSQHGDLAAYLFPALFLPIDLADADQAVHLHQLHGIRGLWGRSSSAAYTFTPQLQYRQQAHGLLEIAADGTHQDPVFAPYAAALALLCTPEAAAGCLKAMQNLGALGLHGFCDAIDLSSEGRVALVQAHSVAHQGAILCACAHVLANQPLQRYFCAIPAVEACLPLLDIEQQAPVLLPSQPLKRLHPIADQPASHIVRQLCTPLPAALLGTREAGVWVNSAGSSCIHLGRRAITRFRGSASMLEGLQLYLIDEDRPYRLTDTALPGETVYSRGTAVFHRTCGSLRTSLTIFADPCDRRILHLLEISNLATVDRQIEVADCLIPDMSSTPDVLEAALAAPQHLYLHNRADGMTLHHRFGCSAEITAAACATDAPAFLGTGGSLRSSAALREPMADLFAAGNASCLSFRFCLPIGGRGQVRCLFSTSLSDTPLPVWEEVPGLLELSSLHEQALISASGVSRKTESLLPQFTGTVLWQKRPFLDDSPVVITLQHAAALPELTNLLALHRYFSLKGHILPLHVVCTDETLPLVEAEIAKHASERPVSIHIHCTPAPAHLDALLAEAQLVVRSDRETLSEHLSDLQQPFSAPLPATLPNPCELPSPVLLNPGGYGGFEPDSGDYLILLEARQTLPADWLFRHSGNHAFQIQPDGLTRPFDERLILRSADGLCFDPLTDALPRSIRVNGSVLHWQTFADRFTISLKTAPIPGSHAMLRSLRIRDLTGQNASLTFCVSAALAHDQHQSLTLLPDAAVAESTFPIPFAAPVTDGFSLELIPSITREDSAILHPQAVSLCISLAVPANGSADAAWITGFADSADAISLAQSRVRETGASAVFREAMEEYAAALPPITVKTPEPALDLFVNQVLARQLAFASPIAILPLLMLTSPEAAADKLLRCAATAKEREDTLFTALIAGFLLEALPPEAIREKHLPGKASSLSQYCTNALRQPPSDPAQRFLTVAAAGLLTPMDHDLSVLRHELLNTGDIHLWQGDHYGEDEYLDLNTQSWAALAYGDTSRTQKALRTCRDVLYDKTGVLMRSELPRSEHPICPGLPGNGGQQARAIVVYLAALLHLGHTEQAWELLRALNPLLRCDSPLHSETYAGAPYYLARGVQALPAAAGQADHLPDDEAAALLYAFIIRQLLGLSRKQEGLAFAPHVPPEWDEFSITLRIGASSWYLTFERGLEARTIDGVADSKRAVIPTDDGRIHQIRIPLP